MKVILWGVLLFLTMQIDASIADNISERLIVRIIDKNLPLVLYEHKDKSWDLGVYSLRINKLGPVRFSSTDTHLNLYVPIEAVISGEVKKSFLGRKISVACNNNFVTESRLEIEPEISETGSRVNVSIFAPIPDTRLNCDGLKVPIKLLLEKVFSDNKNEWEQRLESDINLVFQQFGI